MHTRIRLTDKIINAPVETESSDIAKAYCEKEKEIIKFNFRVKATQPIHGYLLPVKNKINDPLMLPLFSFFSIFQRLCFVT